MQNFELTKEYLNELKAVISSGEEKAMIELIDGVHPADIAEILDELDVHHGKVILNLLDADKASDVLIELEEEVRKEYLDSLSSKEIAEQFIENLESDDAADVMSELSEDKREEVIAEIEDVEQASDIVDLLNYEEGTAGALMAKELIWVNENWTVMQSVKEMRRQAENIDQVYTVYVVDDNEKLLGRLPVKKLLTNPVKSKIQDIYKSDIKSVRTKTPQDEVALIMEKYDLVVLPVIDELHRLVGRITIDDVVDVIKEEADKDYQMASGISSDVDQTDSVIQLTKARLPWLIIGLAGGMLSALVIGNYEDAIKIIPAMAFFIPLITAMAGNVGVQSSAIIVQGLANHTMEIGGIVPKLSKEFMVAIINGLVISFISLLVSYFFYGDYKLGITVSISLFTVIIVAALLGTLVPLLLDKYKIDPALATGPFITTMNDILGLFIYFIIGQLVFSLI